MTSEFIQLNDLIETKLYGSLTKIIRTDEGFAEDDRYFDSFTGNNSRATKDSYLGAGISDGITIPLTIGETYQFISNIRTFRTGSAEFYCLRLIDETTGYSIIGRHVLSSPDTNDFYNDTLDMFVLTATNASITLNFDLTGEDTSTITVTDWNVMVKKITN